MDNYYPIEVKICSKNGWFTPAEAKNYYGRYSREGITVHWWGDGTGADNHDNIVNYISGGAARGEKSVNYVLSDNKISLLVNPDDVAWCSQSGNPTTISVETQPTLGDEGYKKWGWLVWQLEGRYGHSLSLYPHNHWFSTACPGTIDINRIRAEANKWASGGYNPQPTPTPAPTPTPPAQITLQITDIPNKHVKLIRDANLWDLHFAKYADAKAVKSFPAGTDIEVSAIAQHPLGSSYYLSEYSFSKGIGNGINVKDTEDVVAPTPPVVVTPPTVDPPVVTPVPTPTPEPTPVQIPVLTDHDKEQDAEITGIKALLQKVVDFLASIFSNFKK